MDIGCTHHWVLGGLDLSITRLKSEWEINYSYFNSENSDIADSIWHREPEVHLNTEAVNAPQNHIRVACRQTADKLLLTPRMADRSLVSRPWDMLQILPGEEVTLFIGALLWLRIEFGERRDHAVDIPLRRISDTWFGPSPREGELCYASRTHAFTDQSQLINRPYRALLPVQIQNQDESHLILERINLPVPYLNLYRDKFGTFWAQGLTLTREMDRNNVRVEVDESAPKLALGAKMINESLETADSNVLVKAFDMLFA